jgi:hypothetical protein
MHKGIAPPHGFALSNFRSKRKVSIPFSWAKTSAAHAPEGPPPTTATLYFISNELELCGALIRPAPMKLLGVKAATIGADAKSTDTTFIFFIYYYTLRILQMETMRGFGVMMDFSSAISIEDWTGPTKPQIDRSFAPQLQLGTNLTS